MRKIWARCAAIAAVSAATGVLLAACGSDDSLAGPNDGGSASGADASANDGAPDNLDGSSKDGALAVDGSALGCGVRTGMRGLTHRTVTVGGVTRTYLIYLPGASDPKKPLPLVYVFHGYTMSGQQMHDITQYAALADSEGIAVAFPDGIGGADALVAPWNVENSGQTVCGGGQSEISTGDDFGFMDAMKADVEDDQCVDSAHVYATGFSMGGYFSHHIGCYRSDIRAVAPSAGGTLADLSVCTTGHVPIIIFHGSADPLITPGCADPNAVAVAGFPASAKLWAAKNGCAATYKTVATNGAAGNGQCYVYDGCPADGQVELCTFTGMGHCWAGGSTSGQGAIYGCSTYADATALEWSFFKKYAW